jgi:hypothetical protein
MIEYYRATFENEDSFFEYYAIKNAETKDPTLFCISIHEDEEERDHVLLPASDTPQDIMYIKTDQRVNRSSRLLFIEALSTALCVSKTIAEQIAQHFEI